MIVNSEKKQTNRNNKELGYINYHRTKSVRENITFVFQDSAGQVKIELHATISNGFHIIRFKQFHEELEIRSVEHGICPIATSTMNELFSYNYGA